jgi:DNA polymerase-3 subunit alpha
MDEALKLVDEYNNIYPGRFFLEMQVNGLNLQEEVNVKLMELSESAHTPLVATNDCHFLNQDDHEAHYALVCMQNKKLISYRERMCFGTGDLYFKSMEEMGWSFCFATQEVLDNTMRIADMCGDYKLACGRTYYLPVFKLPQGISEDDELKKLAREGLHLRLLNLKTSHGEVDETLYRERLEYELDVISSMGFQRYFLIVHDYVSWSRENGIPVGPSLGADQGSLVVWALQIACLDPIAHKLIFERFLNPELWSLPDIDICFCERNLERVIEYVVQKFGIDSVAKVTVFETMDIRRLIGEVGSVLGLTAEEIGKVRSMPDKLLHSLRYPRWRETDPAKLVKIKKLVDISLCLEGLMHHTTTQDEWCRTGMVIADKPLLEYLPLYLNKGKELVTQYDRKTVEMLDLLIFDLNGLPALTLIQDTLDNIKAQGQAAPDMDNLPLDDADTYAFYSRGETDGIFFNDFLQKQFPSSVLDLRNYLRELKPSCFEDIIATMALYYSPSRDEHKAHEFIQRKHGHIGTNYPLPQWENCLKDTYGLLMYQEQFMQIAHLVAGYTMGEADMLRRRIHKTDTTVTTAENSKFVKKAKNNQVDENKANEIFNILKNYCKDCPGYSKAWGVAYAFLSYQTAYLKCHYRAEFMAALLLSNQQGNTKDSYTSPY